VLPDQARFVIATVDQQKRRFVVQITAFGSDRERWVIDRFNITKSKRIGEDGSVLPIAPFENPEDFDVLLNLLTGKTYKFRDGAELPIRLLAIDTGGLDEATVNAYTFWRTSASKGLADRVMLVKGDGNVRAKRLNRSVSQKVSGVPLWLINTNLMKAEVFNDISRAESGPGKLHLSSLMGDWFFQEFLAETQDPLTGKWVKTSAKARNESLDLSVYAIAAFAALGGDAIDWGNEAALPLWAQAHEMGDIVEGDQVAVAAVTTAVKAEAAPSKGAIDWASMGKDLNG
jgi:phage terminase large subunit GpA-like protein